MTSKIRLRDWDEFYQRALRMEDVGQAVERDVSAHVPGIARQVWNDSTTLKYAQGPQDRMALGGARVRSSARSTTFTGATRSGIGDKWYAVEFGDGVDSEVTYRSRRGGTTFPVTRHTQRMLPRRNPRGRVLYRYGKEAIRRVLAAYAQTIARTLHETLEGRK